MIVQIVRRWSRSWRPSPRHGTLQQCRELDEVGYSAACAELLAAQYGAPQMRWRLSTVTRPWIDQEPGPRRRYAPGRRRSCRRSEEHTSELQSHVNLVCRLL